MKLSELQGNPDNPRKISDLQLHGLKASIEKFGDLGGIFYNQRTKRLGGGHQRVKCLSPESTVHITKTFDTPTETGTVSVGYVKAGDERFAFRIVDWDEQTEMAANLAANKHGGEFDDELLAKALAGLDDELKRLTGFTDEEIAGLLPPAEGLCDPDEVPEVPKVAKTQRGELWVLGDHRVLCGDSTNKDDVARLMGGEKADITFTSPPYNAAKESFLNGRVKGFENKYENSADSMTDDEYLDLLCKSTDLALENSTYVFVNLQLLAHNRIPLASYWNAQREKTKDVLVWNKRQAPPNIVKGAFNTKFEFIFCFSNDSKTRGFPADWQGQYPNVVETESNAGNEFAEDHRAGFPVTLPTWFLEKLPFAKSVYDPFLGTGTTAIAAERLRRKAFGMELDPFYIDVILARWAKFTGKDPVREDGMPWSKLSGESHAQEAKTKLRKSKSGGKADGLQARVRADAD